jgi:hypothetical protein
MKKILRTIQRKKCGGPMNLRTIVGHVGGRCKGESSEQQAWRRAAVGSAAIKARITAELAAIFALIEMPNDTRRLDEVERPLRDLLFRLGRLMLAYFLARRQRRVHRSPALT